jgi:hypothetical protein
MADIDHEFEQGMNTLDISNALAGEISQDELQQAHLEQNFCDYGLFRASTESFNFFLALENQFISLGRQDVKADALAALVGKSAETKLLPNAKEISQIAQFFNISLVLIQNQQSQPFIIINDNPNVDMVILLACEVNSTKYYLLKWVQDNKNKLVLRAGNVPGNKFFVVHAVHTSNLATHAHSSNSSNNSSNNSNDSNEFSDSQQESGTSNDLLSLAKRTTGLDLDNLSGSKTFGTDTKQSNDSPTKNNKGQANNNQNNNSDAIHSNASAQSSAPQDDLMSDLKAFNEFSHDDNSSHDSTLSVLPAQSNSVSVNPLASLMPSESNPASAPVIPTVFAQAISKPKESIPSDEPSSSFSTSIGVTGAAISTEDVLKQQEQQKLDEQQPEKSYLK